MQPHSIRRINQLQSLNKATRYLEVGVNKGETFFNVNFQEKVAVDPLFRFDVADHQGEGVLFIDKVSDKFFADAQSHRQFDIIFLDGLHTYDQTYRDFTHSLLCSHPKTFILIDDTFPADSISAMRSQKFSRSSRKKAFPQLDNLPGWWHGDTF
jgi:hypothetical protein